jgi:hypothetical protein
MKLAGPRRTDQALAASLGQFVPGRLLLLDFVGALAKSREQVGWSTRPIISGSLTRVLQETAQESTVVPQEDMDVAQALLGLAGMSRFCLCPFLVSLVAVCRNKARVSSDG